MASGGAAEVGGPFSLSCPLPLLRTHPPSLLVCCFFCFSKDGSNQYSIWTVGGKPILSEKRGGKSHFGITIVSAVLGICKLCIASHLLLPIMSMQTKQDHREPVLLMALMIMLQAKLCLPGIVILFCVCRYPEKICRALLIEGRGGKLSLSNT